ncbi:MAG: DUF3500 domain-containing protein, partial [Planctomycetes bacterium]|nr:DUF3500 domain-containing protein [Planctomycetota bacterium]
MTESANEFLATLSDEERAKVVLKYQSDQRVGWHFIPKESRKGLQLREMNKEQKEAAHKLLQACLSNSGYKKTLLVMKLETLLHILEGDKRRFARDSLRY